MEPWAIFLPGLFYCRGPSGRSNRKRWQMHNTGEEDNRGKSGTESGIQRHPPTYPPPNAIMRAPDSNLVTMNPTCAKDDPRARNKPADDLGGDGTPAPQKTIL